MSRINTNISALQAYHRLNKNNTELSTRLQRLSSGLKINAGKDAPAGLIASETLRSEINGINQAIDNSQRANNVVNTAEAAGGVGPAAGGPGLTNQCRQHRRAEPRGDQGQPAPDGRDPQLD